MKLFVTALLMDVATVYINCIYVNSNNMPPLTEVPGDIPSAETEVDLTYNAISSLDGRLDHLTNLERLWLSYNKFTTFPNLAMVGDTLSYLVLKGNSISSLDGHLGYLNKLRLLALHQNNFTTFPNLTPVGDTLDYLGIGWNYLSQIDPAQLVPLIKLTTLYLSGNKFKTFPDLSPVGSTLKLLNLNSNEFTSIPATYLSPLVKLKTLSIKKNLLSALPDVSGVSSTLISLDMSSNNIVTVGLAEMQVLNGIAIVNLQSINVTSLPHICYDKPTKVELQGTSLLDLCSCNNTWLKKAEGECALTLAVTDITCPDATKPWTQITHEELLCVCQPAELEAISDNCRKGEKIPQLMLQYCTQQY